MDGAAFDEGINRLLCVFQAAAVALAIELNRFDVMPLMNCGFDLGIADALCWSHGSRGSLLGVEVACQFEAYAKSQGREEIRVSGDIRKVGHEISHEQLPLRSGG